MSKARTVVQGFGNAGSVAARLMSELGSKVVAVSDSRGGIFNPAASIWMRSARIRPAPDRWSVFPMPKMSPMRRFFSCHRDPDSRRPRESDHCRQCRSDPGRTHRRSRQRANYARGRRDPLRPRRVRHPGHPRQCRRGHRLLLRMGASIAGVPLDRAQVNERFQRIMNRAFEAVYDTSTKYDVHMRTAALVRAIDRVAEFTRLRGIYP